MEHPVHVGDLGGIPFPDRLVERGAVDFDAAAPIITVCAVAKQPVHAGDLGGIPVADRRVAAGAAVSAAAALGLGLAAVEAGGHRGEAVVNGSLERGAVGEGLGHSAAALGKSYV